MRRRIGIGGAVLLGLALVAAAGLGVWGPAYAQQGTTVNATESDFKIVLDTNTAQPGQVTFNIKNDSPTTTHEFVVFKTDLAQDQLPLEGSEVNEDSPELQSQGEVEDIAPGATANLPVNLDAGAYVVICNIPGHYQQGMHAALTVAGGAATTPTAAAGGAQTGASPTAATGTLPSTGSGASTSAGGTAALIALAAAGFALIFGAGALTLASRRSRRQ